MSQKEINNYFQNHWYPNQKPDRFEQYEYSGNAILDKINPTSDYVLDVGCGKNPFKGKIANLIGIDPASPDADVKTTLESFYPRQHFDVVLCLGSVNFGDIFQIKRQIIKISTMLKKNGRIFWRCNPGLHDHDSEEFKKLDVFPWTKDLHYTLALNFGYTVMDIRDDTQNRIYAEWVKVENKFS